MSDGAVWLELLIGIDDPSALESLEAQLTAAGAVAITLADAGDAPILEPAPGKTPLWPALSVTVLFPPDIEKSAVERLCGHRPVRWHLLQDRVWEREWLRHYAPMQFGDRLWVGPHDAQPDDSRLVAVHIEPGLGFGSGTHATTALCLDWLAASEISGGSVLDYGCGSGILAVSALVLGADHCVAVDIDAQALDATKENAARNNVTARLDVLHADRLDNGTFDVVIANILANPLRQLAGRISARVAADGQLVLAGLLDAQAHDVAQAYAPAIGLEVGASRDGWSLLVGFRNG